MTKNIQWATINNAGELQIELPWPKKRVFKIHTLDQWNEFLDYVEENNLPKTLTCSSSLDFPKEYTKNPTVIHLCDLLRG